MSANSAIELLRLWIQFHGFPDYELEEGLTRGTYGLIFFLRSKHPNSYPNTLALKTLDPETLPISPRSLNELQREFARWGSLPSHRNVLRAAGFTLAHISPLNADHTKAPGDMIIPVMQMERMDGALSDWIESERYSRVDRLWALAQAFNGLAHLYANEIEGHGDLKPNNLLFSDLRRTYRLPPETWLNDHPWIIKVADLGWADAWVDWGYTNKALRRYLAPERVGENAAFIPEKSDVFSMGIIAAELLQGRHPARNPSKAEKSEGEWRRRALRGDWDVSGVQGERIKSLIEQCLDPNPARRPTVLNARAVLCEELRVAHGVDVEPSLIAWANETIQEYLPYYSTKLEEIERLGRVWGLGPAEGARARKRLWQILHEIEPAGLYKLEEWTRAAKNLLLLIDSDDSITARDEHALIRERGRGVFTEALGPIDHSDLAVLAEGRHRSDPQQPFERFSHLVGGAAEVADIDFETVVAGEWDVSALTVAGYAYHMASRSRIEKTKRHTIEYLDIAIDKSLTEAVPYYFRALRKRECLFLRDAGISLPINVSKREIIEDLEMACCLAPEWIEPQRELESMRRA